MSAVTLGEDGDLLLDVLNLILGFLQVNDLDGHHLTCPVVNATGGRVGTELRVCVASVVRSVRRNF